METPPIPRESHETAERPPSKEEVLHILGQCILQEFGVAFGEHTVRRELYDTAGALITFEIDVKNADGSSTEYSYTRKATYGEHTSGGSAIQTGLYFISFDTDGVPYAGNALAKFENGAWNTKLVAAKATIER